MRSLRSSHREIHIADHVFARVMKPVSRSVRRPVYRANSREEYGERSVTDFTYKRRDSIT